MSDALNPNNSKSYNEFQSSKYLILYHTGFDIIKEPDISRGRKNADFAQGFYLSDNEDFSRRWARNRKDMPSYLNKYILNTEGLKIKTFNLDLEWYDYISSNRNFKKDYLSDYDVIIGPIANDSLYDTLGIITSGLLKKEQDLEVLKIGNRYNQIVIKSQKALAELKFVEARTFSKEEIEKYQGLRKQEEQDFQTQFNNTIDKLNRD